MIIDNKNVEDIKVTAGSALDGTRETIRKITEFIADNDADPDLAIVPMLELIAGNLAYMVDELNELRDVLKANTGGDNLQ